MPHSSGIRLLDAATPTLVEQVRTLFRLYAAEFAGSIDESLCLQGFELELAGLPGRYGPPGGCLLLAMDGDLLAGCVAVRGLDPTTCEMKRLYVVPDYRGQRLGRRLVEAATRRAHCLGYARMLLDTLPEMAEAIRLYRTLGFVETDRYWDNPITRTIYLEKKLGTVGTEPDRAE